MVPAQLRTTDISIVCFKANKVFLNCQNKNATIIKSIFLVMSSTATFSPTLNTFNIKETWIINLSLMCKFEKNRTQLIFNDVIKIPTLKCLKRFKVFKYYHEILFEIFFSWVMQNTASLLKYLIFEGILSVTKKIDFIML